MASTSSSHQLNALSEIQPPNKRRKIEESSRVFDVFINHRGPDVKHTLATHLYDSLKARGISAFLDLEEKERGVSFVSTIETAIKSAYVHIAIFSEKYAESDWCLRELVLMLESNAKIFPVFYKVEPWELRYIEKGVYAEAFRQHQEKGRYPDKMIKEWKEALQKVSYTAGDLLNPESNDSKDIVSAVEKEVKRKKIKLYVAKYPVGLHKLVVDFERLCLGDLVQDFESNCRIKKAANGKANVVGIFGMGGVGKTTLSKELFNQKRSKYRTASFLFDVREACASGKLPSLQSKLLKDIFGEDQIFHSSEEGTSCLRGFMERSSSLSFLIVLDDIDHVEQLDALLPMDILKKSNNHLVIITTRNVGVLVSAGIDIGYHLKGLDGEDGRELFCWHAFDQPLPLGGYGDLVQNFVNMCGGLPLSLIVLGRHVFGRDQWYWQDELAKVKETLPGDIKRRLKISVDTLDNVEKQIFMDIACFFIGKSITKAMVIWKGSGWRARRALQTLKEKCLVEEVKVMHTNRQEHKWESTTDGSALRMHDHLRDLGREMADELSHPRRMWDPNVLKSLESKGFRDILAETKDMCFHSFLDKSMGCDITYFLGQPEDGSDTSLLWLQLEYLSGRPRDLNSDLKSSISSWIPLQNLQCLRISNGRFQKLWQSDVQMPSHLKELQIHDTFLEEFPDFLGKLNNMEKLVLHADDIQTGFWSLFKSLRMDLRSLQMTNSALLGVPAYNDTSQGATTFNSLVIYHSKRFWEGEVTLNNEGTAMSNVEDLDIRGCRFVTKILIDGNRCARLQSLKISEMKNLIEVGIARIKTLKCLKITSCEKFKRFLATPDSCKIASCVVGDLTKLTRLVIKQCPALEELTSFARVSNLEEIEIDDCEKLENIILPTALTRLDVNKCRNLHRVAVAGDLTKLTWLVIKQCPALEQLPSFARVSNLEEIEIFVCEKLENITLPTALTWLYVNKCRNLHRVAVAGDLTKLTRLYIKQCPALEQLPSFARVSNLKELFIDDCEKLENITLPTTLAGLCIKGCRVLQRISGIADLSDLTWLYIAECPKLSRLGCLDKIAIDTCNIQQNISTHQYTRLTYCSYAVLRYLIDKWKRVPIWTCAIGKAAVGAESSLKEDLFSDANIGVDGVREIRIQEELTDWWSGVGAVIVCFVVVVDSSTLAEDINKDFAKHYCDFKIRQGESIITIVASDSWRYSEMWEYLFIIRFHAIRSKGFRVDLKKGEEWKTQGVLRTIVDRLYDYE